MSILPAFYHPTTIIGIDDDSLFLGAVAQLFSSQYLFKAFNHPEKFLSFFEHYKAPLEGFSFLRSCEHDEYCTSKHSLVDFNVSDLCSLQNFSERMQEISVIIVDYTMPGMNGIELCRKLNKFPCKKILLTGNADDQAAISAFNENIIDRFIRKDSPDVAENIRDYVDSLSRQYFREYTNTLVFHLEADRQLPLTDPEFIQFFQA